jgi:1-acyl-sn-glycerol-3-phosphate acyltransferase
LVKRPGTVHFRIGETIPSGLKRDEIEARVHAAINALER